MSSIYERSNNEKTTDNRLKNYGIAIGRIEKVDVEKRLCSVRTFVGEGACGDKLIKDCQWLSTDAHVEGDESTCIPREGSYGLVFFVAGAAFVWGYFKPIDSKKGAVTGKEASYLNSGDKVISTVGGNRFVIKANGSIEIHAKETLKTVYYPLNSTLSDSCRAYQFSCDGGTLIWSGINKLNQTLKQEEVRREIGRVTPIYLEKKGYVDANTAHTIKFGIPVLAQEDIPTPLYSYTQTIDGSIKQQIGVINIEAKTTGDYKFSTPTATINISNKGDISVTNPTVTIDLTTTGDINIKNPTITIDLSKSGDISVKNPTSEISISKSGDIRLQGPVSALNIEKDGKIGLGQTAAELLDLFDQFLDAFINQPSLCMTGTGPSSPLNAPAMALLQKIKQTLALIKGKV